MFKIFDKLGGIEPTLDVIQRRRHGMRPSMRAVQDWKARKAIPPINSVLLMAECQERGIPFDFADCRLVEEPKSKSFPRHSGQGRARP